MQLLLTTGRFFPSFLFHGRRRQTHSQLKYERKSARTTFFSDSKSFENKFFFRRCLYYFAVKFLSMCRSHFASFCVCKREQGYDICCKQNFSFFFHPVRRMAEYAEYDAFRQTDENEWKNRTLGSDDEQSKVKKIPRIEIVIKSIVNRKPIVCTRLTFLSLFLLRYFGQLSFGVVVVFSASCSLFNRWLRKYIIRIFIFSLLLVVKN